GSDVKAQAPIRDTSTNHSGVNDQGYWAEYSGDREDSVWTLDPEHPHEDRLGVVAISGKRDPLWNIIRPADGKDHTVCRNPIVSTMRAKWKQNRMRRLKKKRRKTPIQVDQRTCRYVVSSIVALLFMLLKTNIYLQKNKKTFYNK
ncbi:hypothetical protein M8C21_022879, partial [Ambrosia artemisiifolia]